MRRVVAGAVLLTACSGGTTGTSVAAGGLDLEAREFAISAQRALIGTRFEDVSTGDLTATIVSICEAGGPLAAAVDQAVGGLASGRPGPGDDAIIREVLLTAVAEVCPQRGDADVTAAYLASVRLAVDEVGGVAVDDGLVLTAGLSACTALATGNVDNGVISAAAALFGIEASLQELQRGALDEAQALTVGAVLASAVVFLCPQHRELVEGQAA